MQFYGSIKPPPRSCISKHLFQWVYGQDFVVPSEFVVHRLSITHATHMKNEESIAKCVTKLMLL
jgi:hypothetical protein